MYWAILCLFLLTIPDTAASSSGPLETYKQNLWTNQSLNDLFEAFSHVVGEHCELDNPNSTCSQCLTAERVQNVLTDGLDTHTLSVYLLVVKIHHDDLCGPNHKPNLTYYELLSTLHLHYANDEELKESLTHLLEHLSGGDDSHGEHSHESTTSSKTEVHDHDHTNHSDHNVHTDHKDHSDHGDNHNHGEVSHKEHNGGNHTDHDHGDHDHGDHDHGADHGDDHGDHDHGHDHAGCFNVETIMYAYERYKRGGFQTEEVLSHLIVDHLLAGDSLTSDCPVRPLKRDFTLHILEQLNLKENATHIPYKDLETLVAKIREVNEATTAEEEDHSGHLHKRAVHDHDHDHDHDHAHEEHLVEKCLSVEEIAGAFGIEHGADVPLSTLSDLSVALLQQLAGGFCTSPSAEKSVPTPPTDFQKYGLSTISVAIISSLALLGGLLFPCLEHDFVQDVLTLFIGLAIGTMAGDALLHLIPQALGLHEHSGDGISSITIEDYTLKMFVVIAAIYVFFIFETVMARFGHSHIGDDHGHGHSHVSYHADQTMSDDSSTKSSVGSSVVQSNGQTPGGYQNNGFSSSLELTETKHGDTPLPLPDDIEIMRTRKKSPIGWLKLPTVAYMVIFGDALHNLVDGLAIGAAFAYRYEAGIAISIAVLCHELPHELGDFAVLLSTGLTPKKVLLANFFCACCAFIGLYIGLLVSSNQATRQWIFAATAGMFLYVALVNMIPELARRKCKSTCRLFFLQNIGLIIGFGCMLLIAVFEEHIRL